MGIIFLSRKNREARTVPMSQTLGPQGTAILYALPKDALQDSQYNVSQKTIANSSLVSLCPVAQA